MSGVYIHVLTVFVSSLHGLTLGMDWIGNHSVSLVKRVAALGARVGFLVIRTVPLSGTVNHRRFVVSVCILRKGVASAEGKNGGNG